MRMLPGAIVTAALLCGCASLRGLGAGDEGTGRADGVEPALRVEPLPVQQARAYPETATGIFASLADFEDVPGGDRGHGQVGAFSIDPPGEDAACTFVVNVTRTGVGAMEVTLPAACQLVFRSPHVRDFSGYKLLSLSVYARSLRDDLRITLVTDGASWQSHRTLIQPGWNTVLVDIQRLADVPGFDARSVRAVRIGFADAAGPVWFNLDDIMVIDNERTIHPSPPGMVLRRTGLDYALQFPSSGREVRLAQGAEGLWRLEGLQAEVRLAAPGRAPADRGEHLELMGTRRVGQVELLEHNRVRVRLASTWYFPSRAGEWASLAVRRIRWEHTLYADGRCVTQGTLNNAGGRQIGAVGLYLPVQAAWMGGGAADHFVVSDFAGEVARWRYLVAPGGPHGKAVVDSYLGPGRIRATLAADGVFAPGDAGHDGFDESQGCFFLGARAGQCRFVLVPPAGGLWDPVFLIAGGWAGPIHATSEGRAIRRVVRRPDGSALFVLPGLIRRPTAVEVTGAVAPLSPQ